MPANLVLTLPVGVDLRSQQELSDIVGAARENVNKLLRTWQRAGLLELGKRRIVIRELDALERLN